MPSCVRRRLRHVVLEDAGGSHRVEPPCHPKHHPGTDGGKIKNPLSRRLSGYFVDSRGGTRTRDPGIMSAVTAEWWDPRTAKYGAHGRRRRRISAHSALPILLPNNHRPVALSAATPHAARVHPVGTEGPTSRRSPGT